MEFLRFGSSIPGSYWGCCAMCIIQNFKFDPDEKASIELVSGDGGGSLGVFAGTTYRDIFKQRLRIGTFSQRDMPDHGFLAILTESQISGGHGAKWLKILKEEGFEFIRTVDNSVYSGQSVITNPDKDNGDSRAKNYLFGMFRNVGTGCVKDQFTPPKQWSDMGSVVPEAWNFLNIPGEELTREQQRVHLKLYNKLGAPKFLTKEQVIAAGAPVTLAGLRSKFPQQKEEIRTKLKEDEAALMAVKNDGAGVAFPCAAKG